ncbi:hypothetical protein GCM10009731_44870 [Streptomyces globosus]
MPVDVSAHGRAPVGRPAGALGACAPWGRAQGGLGGPLDAELGPGGGAVGTARGLSGQTDRLSADRSPRAYADNQGQPASLVAVTARSNRSRADQDPADWLPPSVDALCRYGAEWTATKLRWSLAVDEAERDRLLDIAGGCSGTDVGFTPAP